MATDGTYLYTHSRVGLLKIGTGKHGTTPGLVYGAIHEYRANERSTLVCVNDKLYYRSINVYPAFMLVLDSKLLLEIGPIYLTGSDSIADLSKLNFGIDLNLNTSRTSRVVNNSEANAPPDNGSPDEQPVDGIIPSINPLGRDPPGGNAARRPYERKEEKEVKEEKQVFEVGEQKTKQKQKERRKTRGRKRKNF
eukprot:TRINITY_DN1979_c0_g1_i1.p1 TRINITY_DN1979_c0_g1~~TRINITY_DN1979_c0_g1_i1.p1  ORF type:complete len:215 (-),score=53.28 TRINITY_DN1979_c0_g1_i1:156-737(-)